MENNKEYEQLKSALTDVGRFIKQGRKSLAESNPDDILDKYLPDSTAELEAVVKATEKASNDIMDACDNIEAAASKAGEAEKQIIMAETAKIFAACGFQDITGQRVSKVVSYLNEVELKSLVLVKHLKDFFDREGTLAEEYANNEPANAEVELTDEELKNGPQLEGQGLSQADVDAMLNDF